MVPTPVLGAAIGFSVFVIGIGLEWANPFVVDWWLNGDWATHFIGWHLYRAGPLSFPLGATPLLQWPMGTSVGLTDSIPLFAIGFKLLGSVLPSDFQYLGLWMLLCYVLQGLFGTLLVRLVTPRRTCQLLGATLLVLSPPFVQRFGHPALCAHWLLLAALWLYFRGGSTVPSTAWLGSWMLVVSVASATHPYIAMMVLTLAAAAMLRALIAHPRLALRVSLQAVVLLACAGFVLWQSGYFIHPGAEALQAEGFGHASMNLLSPISPAGGASRLAPGPVAHATSGQYEGYAYLGAGMLLLAAVAFATRLREGSRPSARRLNWDHLPIALACVFLTLLALSPVVTIGSRVLVSYDPTWWGPFSIFRASGRMFWPVYYVLALGMLTAAFRFQGAQALALLIVALVAQAADLSGTFQYIRGARTWTVSHSFASDFWSAVPQHYSHVTLFKTNLCAGDDYIGYVPFARLAGRHGLTLNAGAAARFDPQKVVRYCQRLNEDIHSGVVSSDTLYVLQPRFTPTFRARARIPIVCAIIDEHSACAARETYVRWQDSFDIMTATFPSTEELSRFYVALDHVYRDELHRPTRVVSSSLPLRLTLLSRYLWYRVSDCDRAEATRKTLAEAHGSRELRICGDPSETPRPMPPLDETLEMWKQLQAIGGRPVSEPLTTHVDPEGEAVWLQTYINERLNNRDAYGARVQVINAIRGLAE